MCAGKRSRDEPGTEQLPRLADQPVYAYETPVAGPSAGYDGAPDLPYDWILAHVNASEAADLLAPVDLPDTLKITELSPEQKRDVTRKLARVIAFLNDDPDARSF